MSEVCETRKTRRCRDTPSASADASHASEGFLQTRVYPRRLHGFGRRSRQPRDGQVYIEVVTRRSGLVALWAITRGLRKNGEQGDAG